MGSKQIRIRYVGTSDAYEDEGTTFPKGVGVPVDDEQAEKLLALDAEEYAFEEISEEEYAKVEQDAEAEKAAAEGAKRIEAASAEDAKRRAAYYGAQSQEEIDAAFAESPDEVAESVPSEESPPEDGDVAPGAEEEADVVRKPFEPAPAPKKS